MLMWAWVAAAVAEAAWLMGGVAVDDCSTLLKAVPAGSAAAVADPDDDDVAG